MNPDYYSELFEKYSKDYLIDEKLEWYEEMKRETSLYDDYIIDAPSYFSTPIDLKVGQLVKFREGIDRSDAGSMGIIIVKAPGKVRVMTSAGELVWAPDSTMEVVSESR